MNIKNILYILSLILLSVFVWTGCIDDDLVKTNDVEEGVPITVTLKLSGAPVADVAVETRASGDEMSALSNLTIYVYDGNGQYEQTVNILEEDLNAIVDAKGMTYSVTIQTTSGTKNLLAIGNRGGGFWTTSGEGDLIPSQMSFEQLKSSTIQISLNKDENVTGEYYQPAQISSDDQMLISGWNEGLVFDADGTIKSWGQQSESDIAVKMKRIMAHINFEIEEEPQDAKGIFTPTSYTVYNVPKYSYLANMNHTAMAEVSTSNLLHYTRTNISTAQNRKFSFSFYMPENFYMEDGKAGDYVARDSWTPPVGTPTGTAVLPLSKIWTNAPQTGTFVVIDGTYEEKKTDGTIKYTGNVEYTIHLGDFSERNYDNFSVERNVSYTYIVKVLGVDNIVVEAQTDGSENQPGAEGEIFDATEVKFHYNLDSHYEKVYLQFDLSSIVSQLALNLTEDELDKAIADKMSIVIQSEAMDYNHVKIDSEPYSVLNKRGTVSPYEIYSSAATNEDAAEMKAKIMDGNNDGKSGFDYKWLEFWPQKGDGLADYPGVPKWNIIENHENLDPDPFADYTPSENANKLMDVYDVIVAMGKVVKKLYNSESILTDDNAEDGITIVGENSRYYARFTVFLNEYYYYEHPLTHVPLSTWSVLTNKIPRELYIWLSSDVSDDGNSHLSKPHTIISQVSMQTIYNSRSVPVNAFGIETYNETPLDFSFLGGDLAKEYDNDLTTNNGRKNQKIWLTENGNETWGELSWNDFIYSGFNGYKASVGEGHATHKLSDAYKYKYGAYACLSRNRDLNGNGVIDDNELRWYLASVDEYIRISMGSGSISSAAQLFIGDKSSMESSKYPSGYYNVGSVFLTSSASGQRLFWPVEKASFGAWNGLGYSAGWVDNQYLTADEKAARQGLPIRCIRVLPALTNKNEQAKVDVLPDAIATTSENEDGNTVVKFKDYMIPSEYRARVDGVLTRHHEDGTQNRFYDGIIVAKNNVRNNYSPTNLNGKNGTKIDPCRSSYYEKDDKSDLGDWRVPNLSELVILGRLGLLTLNWGTDEVGCCTYFSNTSLRDGFGYLVNNNSVTCNLSNVQTVRCVRDVPPGYTFPTN